MRTDFIKIRTRLIIDPNKDIHLQNSDGTFKPSSNFFDKVFESEEDLRSQIVVQINDSLGLHNWAVAFVQVSIQEPFYFADIYSENYQNFTTIQNIISERLNKIKFSFYYRGTIDEYLN